MAVGGVDALDRWQQTDWEIIPFSGVNTVDYIEHSV